MAASLPVLTFHTLDDRPSVISFPPELFRCGLARLHESGHRTVSLLEAVDCLRRGTPFPERSLVITFDDGYQTVYDEAFPVLQRYGMSATIFLTVGKTGTAKPADRLPSLNDRPMLTWRQIREMQQWGITFGAHSLTHLDLTRLPFDQVKAEISDSKAIIEDALGTPVACFAYPYGRYDRWSRDIVRQHFACACSDRLGLITLKSDPYVLERVDMYYLRSAHLFNLPGSKLFPWYIQTRAIPRQIRRAIYWRPRWEIAPSVSV